MLFMCMHFSFPAWGYFTAIFLQFIMAHVWVRSYGVNVHDKTVRTSYLLLLLFSWFPQHQ